MDDDEVVAYSICMGSKVRPAWLDRFRADEIVTERRGRLGSVVRLFAVDAEQAAAAALEIDDIRQTREGDSDAYRRLIERHQDHVAGIMWRFSRDLRVHEELVQDVFVEAYMSLAGYHRKAPFAHWLARIATRVGYHYWKKQARLREAEVFTLEEWDRIPDEPVEEMDPSEAAALEHRLLARLRPRDRLVLTLRYLEGCDVAETARRTGWTRTMVKVQTLRARKKLEDLLAQASEEVEE